MDPEEQETLSRNIERDTLSKTLERARGSPPAGKRTYGSRSALRKLPWAIGIVMMMVAGGLWIFRPVKTQSSEPPIRFEVFLPEGQGMDDVGAGSAVAISQDGTQLVYVAREGDTRAVYHRPVDELEATLLPGTDGAFAPFFSPDGDWIGFFAEQADGSVELKKASLRGGSPLRICQKSGSGGGWTEDDTILFAGWPEPGLWKVSANGGEAESILSVESSGSGSESFLDPQILPGGDSILYTHLQGKEGNVSALSLKNKEQKTLVASAGFARYSPTGHLIYVRIQQQELVAVPFDVKRLEVTGPPVSLVQGVRTSLANGAAHYDFSESGNLMYIPPNLEGQINVVLHWFEDLQPLD